MNQNDSLGRAEELLARLEAQREKLESTDDPDQAIEVLQELADLARQIEVELQAARRAAETDAQGS
jgi:exonuclease VII small subunit